MSLPLSPTSAHSFAAAEHLHRFLLENPNHAGRGSASYQLAEILLAAGSFVSAQSGTTAGVGR